MSQESDTDGLKDSEVLPPQLEEAVSSTIVQKIASAYKPDAIVVSYSVKPGTKPGDNYMSVMYAVEILLKNGSNNPENIDVMLKTMPKNPLRIREINEMAAFVKEANMYTQLFPGMVKFQEGKGLERSQIFSGWPTCFATFQNGIDDYLAMEDLRGKGFYMADRINGLTPPQVRLLLLNLAQFHAISYAQFGGDRTAIMSKYPWLEERIFPPADKIDPNMISWMKSSIVNLSDRIRSAGHAHEADLMSKIYGGDDPNDTTFWSDMNSLVSGNKKHVVINHGDCWTNNVLFHEDGRLKFIDFQASRCALRGVDLAYFMHTSFSNEDLNEREDFYLKLYYDEFIRFLDKLGFDTSGAGLSWEDFMEEWKECKFSGVVMGLSMAPFICAEADVLPDMENLSQDDYGADAVDKMIDQVGCGEGSASWKKIFNLAVNHLPRCRQTLEYAKKG
ncbi:uncharacterized protein LOC110857863 [Folsomia candida]|nr:uncharacterized protein LOC110857863 [Folsomia candida]